MRHPFFRTAGMLLVLGMILGSFGAGPAVTAHAPKGKVLRYAIGGDEFEGCECKSVCQCIMSADATFDECRGIQGYTIKQGHYEGTELKGITFAVALTKSGKNLEKSLGQWEGALFIPETATPAQKRAIEAIMKAEMGQAFAKLEVKQVPLSVSGVAGAQELKIGTIGHLKVAAIKGPTGQVPKIVNAPSPLALPVTYCAKSEIDTYDDGTASWDFSGRNSFYGPFEMKAKN